MYKEYLEVLERTSGEFIDGYPTGNVNVGMTLEEHDAIKRTLIKAEEQAKENAEYKKVLDTIKELFNIQVIEMDSKEVANIIISRKDSESPLHFAQKIIRGKEKINLLKRYFDKKQVIRYE